MRGRKRTWTDEQMAKAISGSQSIAGALKTLGLNPTGANYKTVHRAVDRLSVDTSHWTGQGHLNGKSHDWTKRTALSDVLVSGSTYRNTTSLKRRLLREGLVENCCYECEQESEWNGKPLVMVLDHISGDNTDNRIENLRMLCPNCNSQQDTFAGRNIGRMAP
jgi:hypothetical protein